MVHSRYFFFFLFCLFCLIFHFEWRLPTLNLLFIVNSMNVQYDAILAKVICGVIDVSMCAGKHTQSVGLGGSIADDLWRR